MNKNLNIFFWSTLTTISVLFFASCENKLEKVNLVTTDEVTPFEITENAEITYSDSGYISMVIKANKLMRFGGDEPYTEFIDGIELTFFNKTGAQDSKLTANYAINFESKKIMEAKGNVIVINKEGDKLVTEHLVWKETDRQIISEEFVEITTKDEIIYGDGLIANEDFSQYKIKNIKGIININEDKNNE